MKIMSSMVTVFKQNIVPSRVFLVVDVIQILRSLYFTLGSLYYIRWFSLLRELMKGVTKTKNRRQKINDVTPE